MKGILIVIALLAVAATKPPIKATTDDGRRVLLKEDGTWEYAKPVPGNKPILSTPKPTEPVKRKSNARAYKDSEGLYRVSRADDGEAQYQVDRINEDLITFIPMCADADETFMASIASSLKLDAYELSNLIGSEEANAFKLRVIANGCTVD